MSSEDCQRLSPSHTSCRRLRRVHGCGPVHRAYCRGNFFHIKHKKCKILCYQDSGTGRRLWWRRWCARPGPDGATTPASTETTRGGRCGQTFPVLRRIQESRAPSSTSLHTVRPLSLGGPTIANRQVL